MNRAILIFGAVLTSAIGCGGGPDDDLLLTKLNDEQINQLCEDAKPESKECTGGVKVTSRSSAECVSFVRQAKEKSNCNATVRDYRDCEKADLCERTQDAACVRVSACGPVKPEK